MNLANTSAVTGPVEVIEFEDPIDTCIRLDPTSTQRKSINEIEYRGRILVRGQTQRTIGNHYGTSENNPSG